MQDMQENIVTLKESLRKQQENNLILIKQVCGGLNRVVRYFEEVSAVL